MNKNYCNTLKQSLTKILANIDIKEFTIKAFDGSSSVQFTLDEFASHYNPEDFDKGKCDFTFKVEAHDDLIASFRVKDQIGCAGIIIFTDLLVFPSYREIGIATVITEFVMQFAGRFGYGIIQAVDRESSYTQVMMSKLGWHDVVKFVNKKTSNNLILWIYAITENKEDTREKKGDKKFIEGSVTV